MLYISCNDIEASVDRAVLIEKMQEAMTLAETDQVLMPPRTYVSYKDNSLGLMPCFSDTGFSTKLVTIFPGNAGGPHPVVNGLVVYNDIKTGAPCAILNGQAVTAIRTGAVGAVGVKHFADSHPHAIGLVGAGTQGVEQVLCAASIRPLTAIYIFDLDENRIAQVISRLNEKLPDVPVHKADTTLDLLSACRTIVLATTSHAPVLPDSPELIQGRCLIATGSYLPDMQELPKAAFDCAGQIFLDTAHARHESGDVVLPLSNGWIDEDHVMTMGKWLQDKPARPENQTTIFKSVGMAAFDLLAAQYIYERALAQGLGTQLDG